MPHMKGKKVYKEKVHKSKMDTSYKDETNQEKEVGKANRRRARFN